MSPVLYTVYGPVPPVQLIVVFPPPEVALAIASGWVAAGAALVKDIAELVVPWYSTLSVTVAVTVPLPSAVGV